MLHEIFARVYARKWAFLGVFLAVFFISFTVLASIGIAPSAFTFRTVIESIVPPSLFPTPSNAPVVKPGEGELPLRIEIPSIGIRATVSNPKDARVSTLDRELLAGTVRYPGSGILGEEGNVLIFGHSSHLPIVHNQAFKAFNDIQNLKAGEPIFLYGEGKVYVYAVEKVEEANASTDAIPLAVDGSRLTLATCDNFGTKQDRFIVTASLVKIEPID
mgnify:FL=1